MKTQSRDGKRTVLKRKYTLDGAGDIRWAGACAGEGPPAAAQPQVRSSLAQALYDVPEVRACVVYHRENPAKRVQPGSPARAGHQQHRRVLASETRK